MTVPTLQILDVLLSDPGRSDWFAFELCRQTRLASGTVTQLMFRLERWGWVASRWEDAVVAHGDGRPRRRFYRLTSLGRRSAVQLMRQRLPGLMRWSPDGGTK